MPATFDGTAAERTMQGTGFQLPLRSPLAAPEQAPELAAERFYDNSEARVLHLIGRSR